MASLYSQLRLIRHHQNSNFLYELTEVPNEEYIVTYEVNGACSEKLYEISIVPNYPDDKLTVVDCTSRAPEASRQCPYSAHVLSVNNRFDLHVSKHCPIENF